MNRAENRMTWTAARDAELRRLVDTGMPYAEIAAKMSFTFGIVFSKNMAIGRARRLGCAVRVTGRKADRLATPNIDPLTSTVFPPPGACQWITNEAVPFQFCGHKVMPAADNPVWCQAHRERVYQKAPLTPVKA